MANLFIENTQGGGLLLESVTWFDRSSESNGVTESTTYTGRGTAFAIRDELKALRGVQTKYGAYKSHSIKEGGGDYDRISVTFHRLIENPTYLYDFKGPTKAFPLESHPSYKTYWNNRIVATNGAKQELTGAQLDAFQAITDGTVPDSAPSNTNWAKWQQGLASKAFICDTLAGSGDWDVCEARKRGVNSYIYPTISVRETIYFSEKPKVSVTIGPATFTKNAIGTKEVAGMDGRAGYPKNSNFGYPKTVGDLLGGSYDEYKKIGVDSAGADVSIDANFFLERSIPNSYPLWICTSCDIKKIGYWYEATLIWQYAGYGVDPDLYPLATARIAGLI
jgi:hypothetical protein